MSHPIAEREHHAGRLKRLCGVCGALVCGTWFWVDSAADTEHLCLDCGWWGAEAGVILGAQQTSSPRLEVTS